MHHLHRILRWLCVYAVWLTSGGVVFGTGAGEASKNVADGMCSYLFGQGAAPASEEVCEFYDVGQVTPSGGVVRSATESGTAFVQVYPQFLKKTAAVTVAATSRPTNLPGEFATSYPADELTEVGDAVKVTIPGSAIDLQSSTSFIGIYAPPNTAYNAQENNIYELYITSDSLAEPFFYFDYYSAEGGAVVGADLLKAILGSQVKSAVEIIIQPVSLGSN